MATADTLPEFKIDGILPQGFAASVYYLASYLQVITLLNLAYAHMVLQFVFPRNVC